MHPASSHRSKASLLAALVAAGLSCGAASMVRAGDTALPACQDRVVRLENGAATLINTQTQVALKVTPVGPNGSVVASSKCCFYAVVDPGGAIDVIDGATGLTFSHSAPVGDNARVEFSPDWCGVAIVNPGGSVIVLNLDNGKSVTSSPVGTSPSVVWGPAGCLFAIVSPFGSVIVANGMTGTLLPGASPVNGGVRVEFSPDGCLYAIIQPGGSVLIYKTATGALVESRSPVGENVKVTFGPDCTFTITDEPTPVRSSSWALLKRRYR